jgi:4-amino-4-deoxy-L-arabinose transferase-like glycosyltransferase
MNSDYKVRLNSHFGAGLVFLLALVPRLADLGKVIVADEQLWIYRTMRFTKALLSLDLAGTYQSGHPGVMTMWIAAPFIGIKHLIDGSTGLGDLLLAAQLPIALFTSVSIVVIFYLLKELYGAQTALVASILLATDPFLIGFSRIIHLDATLATFMTLAVFAILVYLRQPLKRRYLFLSSACTGFAVLAKVPGVFLYPFVGLVLCIDLLFHVKNPDMSLMNGVRRYGRIYIIWMVSSVAVIFVCWPALWLDPGLLPSLFTRAPGAVAHEHGQFFLGEPVDDPGPAFYPVVVLFRATPLVLGFAIIGILGAAKAASNYRLRGRGEWASTFILLLYIFMFSVLITLAAKKMDRYALPVFPMLNVLAAVGVVYLVKAASAAMPKLHLRHVFPATVVLLLCLQLFTMVRLHPYYSSYYNHLVAGPEKAKEILQIGRGEGLDQVGEYLNEKEDATNLSAATDFDYLLDVYFKGKVRTLKIEHYQEGTLDEVDYLVIYISAMQKQHLRIPQEVITYYQAHSPEHTVRINGIEFAHIYNMKR